MKTLPKSLTDPTVLAREFWHFFIESMRSDQVVGKGASDLLMATKFDDLDLEYMVHLVEAMKTTVIDPWALACRDIVVAEPTAFDPLTDDFLPDFEMKDLAPSSDADQTCPCYGCGSSICSAPGNLCFRCRGLDNTP